jgi:hypothetical protein
VFCTKIGFGACGLDGEGEGIGERDSNKSSSSAGDTVST